MNTVNIQLMSHLTIHSNICSEHHSYSINKIHQPIQPYKYVNSNQILILKNCNVKQLQEDDVPPSRRQLCSLSFNTAATPEPGLWIHQDEVWSISLYPSTSLLFPPSHLWHPLTPWLQSLYLSVWARVRDPLLPTGPSVNSLPRGKGSPSPKWSLG